MEYYLAIKKGWTIDIHTNMNESYKNSEGKNLS